MPSQNTRKLSGDLIFIVATEVVFLLLAWRTFSYSFVASLMPGIIIAGILLVNTILLILELRRTLQKRRQGEEEMGIEKETAAVASPGEEAGLGKERKRELEIAAWLVALVVMIYLLGFLVAIPIFLFLFLRIRFSLRWVTTIAIIAGLEVSVYLIFAVWLQTMIYPGLLSILFIPH